VSDHIRKLGRVEYGKFCLSADGAIEPRCEHQRVMTDGVPLDLASFFIPATLTLSVDPDEVEKEEVISFPKRPHGTVIRPVFHGGRLQKVAYRVGSRPEAPPTSRLYTVARYLLDDSARASPYSLYRALGEKLEGYVRGDEREFCVEAIDPPASTLREGFLFTALSCVMSACPVQVQTSEEEFFKLAELLWQELPDGVRPLFSAGWNVGSSMVPRLCMSAGRMGHPSVPRFEVNSGGQTKWSALPEGVDFRPGESWAGARLKPGEAVRDMILEGLSRTQPQATPPRQPPPAADRRVAEQLPDFADPATRARFRVLAEQPLREQGKSLLRRYIDEGEPDLANSLVKLASTLFQNEEAKADVVKLLFRPFSGENVGRADEVSRAFLEVDGTVFEGDEWVSYPRRRMISSLKNRDANALLAAWMMLAPTCENVEFYGDCLSDLRIKAFPETLIASLAAEHKAMFEVRPEPVHYRKLLRGRAEKAILAWFDIPEHETALFLVEHLAELDGVGEDHRHLADSLARLLRCEEPGHDTRFLQTAIQAEQRRRLVQLIDKLYERASSRSDQNARLALIAWAQRDGLRDLRDEYRSPELRLAAGGGVTQGEVFAFVENRIADELPPLADRILDEAKKYVAYAADTNEWRAIRAAIPEFQQWLLFGWETAEDPPILPDDPLTPPPDQLAQLIERWGGAKDSVGRSAALKWLCERCAQLEPAPRLPALLRAIQGVLLDEWREGEECQDIPDVNCAIKVLSAYKPGGERHPNRLIYKSNRFWQIPLALEALGAAELDMGQLRNALKKKWIFLIPYRNWLRDFLAQAERSIAARALLEPATLDFYNPDIEPGSIPAWHAEYETTVLWAAYGKMPADVLQLTTALAAYSANPAEQAQHCTRLLRRHQWNESARGKIVRLIIDGVVNAQLREVRQDILSEFLNWWNKGSPLKLPGIKNLQSPRFDLRPEDEGAVRYENGDLIVPGRMMLLLECLAAAGNKGRKPIMEALSKHAN